MTARTYYLLGLAGAAFTTLFLLFGIGALGIIGAGGRPDLMYLAALAVALGGAVLARFRARGMALALTAAAVVTFAVGLVAIVAGFSDEPGASVVEILGLSGMFAALFAGSAWLFRRSIIAPAA
jgi:hypothetical protein